MLIIYLLALTDTLVNSSTKRSVTYYMV